MHSEVHNVRLFNYCGKYITKLIKDSSHTSKKDIADLLNLTVNALSLKLTGKSLIYIQESLIIANELKMDLKDIFCPFDDEIANCLYGKCIVNVKENPYNSYNLNNKYIKKLLKNNKLTLKNICKLWNVRLTSVYDKFKGDTKITIKEAILLSNLLELDINEIFCPTEIQIVKTLSPQLNKKILDEPLSTDDKIHIDKEKLKEIIIEQDKRMRDLPLLLGISKTHFYNKINNRTSFELQEVNYLCQWTNTKFTDLFRRES